MMKQCFKCKQAKAIDDFYKHPEMADGRLGKCKSCACQDVRNNRSSRRDYYLAYEKVRSRRPSRKAAALVYQANRRAVDQVKGPARQAVKRALRAGLLTRQPCVVCGCTESEAHHSDYSKPLDVTWLCRIHHLAMHEGHFANPPVLEAV